MKPDIPPIDLDIYDRDFYIIKSAIILYLFDAKNERKQQIDELSHYIDKGRHYMYLGITCILTHVFLMFIISYF